MSIKEKQLAKVNSILKEKIVKFRVDILHSLENSMETTVPTTAKIMQILSDTSVADFQLEDLQIQTKKSRHPPDVRCHVVGCIYKKVNGGCYCREHSRNPYSRTSSLPELNKQILTCYQYQHIYYLVNAANQIVHPMDYLKKQERNYKQENTCEPIPEESLPWRMIGKYHPELPEENRYEIYPEFL